jgi:hypothetical protein
MLVLAVALKARNQKTDDPAIQDLAEGLRQLARVIEDDIKKLEREIKAIASRIR